MTHDRSYPGSAGAFTDKEIGKAIGAFLGMSGITGDDVARIRELVGYGAPAQGAPRCDRCGSSGDTYVLCSGCGSLSLSSTEGE